MNSTLANSTDYLENTWDFSVLPILILSMHAFNFTFSLPLNIYVIVLLFSSCGVMDPSDVFHLNQAFAEIFFVLFGPFHILCGLKLCFYGPFWFFLGISMSSRCLFQCCVCYERYLAVVHPVTFLRFKPLRYRVMCCVMIWIISLFSGIFCACIFPRIPVTVFSVIYLFILISDVFCGMSILKKLKRPGSWDVERNAAQMSDAKRKAFHIVSVNLLIFLTQNVPVFVIFSIEDSLSEHSHNLAIVINLAINSVTGLLQPCAVLRRAGKLELIQSVCCLTPPTPAQLQ